jgi:hypothetical protein
MSFDKRLRQGISDSQLAALGALLDHLAVNAAQVDETAVRRSPK